MMGFFVIISSRQQQTTPACRNACLHEAFRRRQALRRAGTPYGRGRSLFVSVSMEETDGGVNIWFARYKVWPHFYIRRWTSPLPHIEVVLP